MIEEKSCPCCGHKKIVRDDRTKEVYCNHCGLIIENFSAIADNNEWETSHEPLSDGLSVKAEMAKIERKYNFKSKSKHKYENITQRYYDLLESELLQMNYKLSEVEDVFNYCFLPYYLFDTDSNAPVIHDNGKKKQLTHKQVIQNFLKSLRFEAFDVSACVSKLKIPKPLRSSWQP